MTAIALRPLAVETDLVIGSGGATVARVRSAGDVLHVDLEPGATAGLAASPGGPLAAARELARAAPALRAADLRVEVRLRGRTVAVAGRGARPSRFAAKRGVEGVELRAPALFASGGKIMSRVDKAKLLICSAAFASFLLSVYLWFLVDKEQGLFVGIWVPSILSLGALLLAGRGRST